MRIYRRKGVEDSEHNAVVSTWACGTFAFQFLTHERNRSIVDCIDRCNV